MMGLTPEQIQSAMKIPEVLLVQSDGMDEIERIRFVYNNAIDDAANFASDMADTNPQYHLALKLVSDEIRKWMTIPDGQSP
jgi:hypothetical protein